MSSLHATTFETADSWQSLFPGGKDSLQNMTLLDTVLPFRDRENESDPLKAQWYLVAAAAVAGAGIGPDLLPVYRALTADLPLETAKLVQRRIKEALLKSTIFNGVPRVAMTTNAIYRSLKPEEIDAYGPRTEAMNDPDEPQKRIARGQEFFDILWTPKGAEGVRETLLKFHPDLYMMNVKLIYEYWGAENRILNNIETEMIAIGALIVMNCPGSLEWHLKGAIRHGATEEQVELAYDIGMAVAKFSGCKIGKMPALKDLDLADTTFH